MLIPKEARWSILIGKDHKSLFENTRADHVAETTKIRPALSSTAVERQRDFEQKRHINAPKERPERRQCANPEEEMPQDRRKKQVPVLLDTRSGNQHTRAFGQPAIDFEA